MGAGSGLWAGRPAPRSLSLSSLYLVQSHILTLSSLDTALRLRWVVGRQVRAVYEPVASLATWFPYVFMQRLESEEGFGQLGDGTRGDELWFGQICSQPRQGGSMRVPTDDNLGDVQMSQQGPRSESHDRTAAQHSPLHSGGSPDARAEESAA